MSERDLSKRHSRKNRSHKVEITPQPKTPAIQPENPRGSERYKRWLKSLAVALPTGAAAMFCAKYDLHQTEILSSHGRDFLGPLAVWYGLQAAFSPVLPARVERWLSSPRPLIYYSVYALGMETFQFFTKEQWEKIPNGGRFDPADFVAYGAGMAFALGVNRLVNYRSSKTKQS